MLEMGSLISESAPADHTKLRTAVTDLRSVDKYIYIQPTIKAGGPTPAAAQLSCTMRSCIIAVNYLQRARLKSTED